MKRVLGFALICISIGMLLILIIPVSLFWEIVLFLICAVTGYLMFCKC